MSKTNSKALITEIAFKLFLETGYWRTSMSDIMKAASLSKGALYHHFNSKENLYQEVINRYFISYYKGVDWEEVTKMELAEIEASIQTFYLSFIPEIQSLTQKGMSRYFILFFEAYDIYPLFKSEIQNFYSRFKDILEIRLTTLKVEAPERKAKEMISKYEGHIFWLSVFPEEKITDLLT